MYTDEEDVAHRAEDMLTAAMRQKVGTLGFAQHKSADAHLSIGMAAGISRYKVGEAHLEGGERTYFNRLVLSMPRHGYIQDAGDHGVRSGSTRERHNPRFNRYTFRTHEWDLPAKDFIDEAVQQSGVVDFVLENITRIRGEDVVFYLKYFFSNIRNSRISGKDVLSDGRL